MQAVDKLYEDCVSFVRVSDCSETLWHYTSTEALLKILETGSLRLSCHRFMNDPSEGQLSAPLVQHCWQLALDKTDSHSCFDLSYFREQRWIPRLDYPGTSAQSTFVFSASLLPDSLSQWARYAADGRGVALGFKFDTSALAKWSIGPGWSYGPFLSKVIYWSPPEDSQSLPGAGSTPSGKLIAGLSDRFYRYLAETREIVDIHNGLLVVAEGIAPSIKAASYHEEQEWRLSAHTSVNATSLYKIQANRFGLAPAMEVPLTGAGIELTELMLGPKLDEANLWSANWLKAKFDLNIKISRSSLSYR